MLCVGINTLVVCMYMRCVCFNQTITHEEVKMFKALMFTSMDKDQL